MKATEWIEENCTLCIQKETCRHYKALQPEENHMDFPCLWRVANPLKSGEEMSIEDVKELILIEMETSSEDVTADTIAVKYRIPFDKIVEAAEQLEKDGILDRIR